MVKAGKNCACQWCNKQFYAPLWKLKDGGGKYCSQSCYFAFKKSKIIQADCHTCNKPFTTFQYIVNQNQNVFCSKECSYKRKNEHLRGLNQQTYICDFCDKSFSAYQKHRRGKNKFCSKACADSFRVGSKAPNTRQRLLGKKGKDAMNWKGGRSRVNGYIKIYSPTHPNRTRSNYVREHILVAEKALGRYLKKGEVIHHLNGIIDDNRLENLYLFEWRGDHTAYHHMKNPPKLTSNLT